jgi:hypothetical protein
VLAIAGKSSRLPVLAFPSTCSPSFQLFSPVTDVLGHVPSDFVPVNRFSVSVHVFAQFSALFTRNRRAGTRSGKVSSRLPVLAFPSTFSPSFKLGCTVPDALGR